MFKKARLIILGGCAVYLGYLIQQPAKSYIDAATIADHDLWYSMQWHGKNVGYVNERWRKKKNYLQWTQLLNIEGIARTEPFTRISQESLQYSLDYPYPLISGSWYVDSQNKQQKFSFVVNKDEITITQNGIDKSIAYSQNWDAQQLWAPQRQALLASQHGAQNMDLKQWNMQLLKSEKVHFSFGEMDQKGIIQAVSYQQPQIAKKLWSFNASGKLLSKSLAGAIKLVLSSESDALKLTKTDVYQSSLLNVDRPLGKVGNISALELEIGELWQQNNAQQTLVTQQTPGTFLQIGEPGSYEKQTRNNFLVSSSLYPQSKRIKRIAKGLISKQKSQFQNLQALLNFTSEFIVDDNQIKDLSVTELLDNPRGDCTEHALLFVTLARAAGIPAREVNGLLYLGDKQQKFSAHVWAEVEVDGHWISVDPTWRKMKLDPGYIRVYGESAANTTTLLALSGKTIHVKKLNFFPI